MSPEHKQALTEVLMGKSVGELINIIINTQEELEEAKLVRRRLKQIQNLCREPEERNPRGRPRKE